MIEFNPARTSHPQGWELEMEGKGSGKRSFPVSESSGASDTSGMLRTEGSQNEDIAGVSQRSFILPDLGEGLEEAEIVEVFVKEGDYVETDQTIMVVETDKSSVELPSPQSGVIERVCVSSGDLVPVGSSLVIFHEENIGRQESLMPKHEVLEPTEERQEPSVAVQASPESDNDAEDVGVDLSLMGQTGGEVEDDGFITVYGGKNFHKLPKPEEPKKKGEVIKLKGARLAMARHMVRSAAEVVPATVTDEALWHPGQDITVRLIQAIKAAVQKAPLLNAWYDATEETIAPQKKLCIGIAMDTPHGLYVPIIENICDSDSQELRDKLKELKSLAFERRLPPEALRGATITLSNFGAFKVGRFAQLVVIPPQVAIIGVGVIQGILGKQKLPISLTFNHRPITGGEASRFLKALIDNLEEKI